MVTVDTPLKVTERSVSGMIADPLAWAATRMGPIRTGAAPKRFDSRIRTREPAMLVRAICRRLCCSTGGPAESGAAVQAATQVASAADGNGVVAAVRPTRRPKAANVVVARFVERFFAVVCMPITMHGGDAKKS